MTAIVVAHPSADQYGSDLQLLETITIFRESGHEVRVLLPHDGPLVTMLEERGASVHFLDFPILRKNLLSASGLLKLAWHTVRTLPGMWRELRSVPDARTLWINTITMPSWFVVGRLARLATIAHVHEAEDDGPRWARLGLAAPALLAHRLVSNSAASAASLTSLITRLDRKITVVHNGMSGPENPPRPRHRTNGEPAKIALIARLSPRKGIDVALEAIGQLRTAGINVHLTVCGTVFEGYEWFEQDLHKRAQQSDVAGAISFAGYVSPTWPVLAASDVVIVPSRVEPFGNTAVEALLAQRPLVASDTQGLREIVTHEVTGLLVEPGNPTDLAQAIARLLNDPGWAAKLARAGQTDAVNRFSTDAYRTGLLRVLNS